MKSKVVTPTTIAGIKRLARQMKKAEGIAHHLALNKAAQAASYRDFAHAQTALQPAGTQSESRDQGGTSA